MHNHFSSNKVSSLCVFYDSKSVRLNLKTYCNAWYKKACSKCKLNHINKCLNDLKMAIPIDENYIEFAKKEDFNSIKNNEEFRSLLGIQVKS